MAEKRWFETESAKALYDQRIAMGWAKHLRPFSTLIAGIGDHWKRGCKEAVTAMAEHTYKQGIEVCLWEVPDRCYQRYDAIGTMRNEVYLKAMREGWEFLLYCDNDVKPPADALFKLLLRYVPIISPIITYIEGAKSGTAMPHLKRNQGLAMVTSFVLSFFLCKTAVFYPYLGGFWENPLGADEEYHFEKLSVIGHRPFVDTDVIVPCVESPHYPLDKRPKE